jgi:MoaA/NifB/PqqE/SkfB family radical SAM enzyme
MTHAEIAPVAPEVALRRPAALQATPRPFAFVLVKLASRCNINCTYCYWFRDAQVYEKPAVLTLEAEDAFCLRLEEHIREFNLPVFLLVFHGGEPRCFRSAGLTLCRKSCAT